MSDYKKNNMGMFFVTTYAALSKALVVLSLVVRAVSCKYAVQRDLTFHYRNKMNKSRN